jgi:hypothetical protein
MQSEDVDDILPEYDFESPKVQQGRAYRRALELRNRRTLTPELARQFPDDASVNAALEEYLQHKRAGA